MKKIHLNLISLTLVVSIALLATIFYGCEKEEMTHKTISTATLSLEYSNLEWIRTASYDCIIAFNYFTENAENDSITITNQRINNYFNNVFASQNYIYPTPTQVSNSELSFFQEVALIFQQCPSIALESNLNLLIKRADFDKLNNDEKERIYVFIHTILGVTDALITLGDCKKQGPRDSYCSSNGENLFERMLLNCIAYQTDGHFETLVGGIAYVAGLPTTFFLDIAICGNEIIDGLWNHVN